MKKHLLPYLLFCLLITSISFFFSRPTQAQQVENITIRVPEPRITIPGLDFETYDPEKLIQRDNNGRIFIQVPYLAEYIAKVYKYLVGIASILAVIMIIIAGFQWSLSGGNTATIDAAKKKIGNAVTGLVLAVGSYAILFAINPALVKFRALRLNYVDHNNTQIFYKGDLFPEDTTSPTIGDVSTVPTTMRAQKITCNGVERYVPANVLGISMDCGSCDIISRRSPPPACRIARESVVGTNNMLAALDTIAGAGGYNSKPVNVAGCPLHQQARVGLTPGENTVKQSPSFTKYDELFTRYANCLPIANGERILKSIAYAESRFVTRARSAENFSGLFQTKSANCFGALNKYGDEFARHCSDVNDPETSTAVGTAMAMTSINLVTAECINKGIQVSPQALHAWIYVGHHSGHGALRNLLRRTQCEPKKMCAANYDFWQNHLGGRFRDNTPPPCAQ